MPEPARTIEEVVGRLTDIVESAHQDASPLGYFPALYRRVTVSVRDRIADGYFDDGERLETLDVLFANRYLDAWAARASGARATGVWQYAFEVGEQYWPIVLQHLLVGINAHINLDLGVAAAETAGSPRELERMRSDFDRINEILASLVGDVKEELAQIWMTLRLFNRYLGRVEDAIINFSLGKARRHAWRVAQRLVSLEREEWDGEIERLCPEIVEIGRIVRHPGAVGTLVNGVIRLGERGGTRRKIDVLSRDRG